MKRELPVTGPLTVDGISLHSIRQINLLPEDKKREAYSRYLLPRKVLERFGIDPETRKDKDGKVLVTIDAKPGTSMVKLTIKHAPDARDPLVLLELADSGHKQLEVLMYAVNNPESERYDIDVDSSGGLTKFGLKSRNTAEEIRAMEAGLTPGQVRHALRLLSNQIYVVESFAASLGHKMVVARPLAYHNAIMLEQHGFGYLKGRAAMEKIDRDFAPGGPLYEAMDGSTPFRRRGMEETIRGRSWAIHDGILGVPWTALEVSMFKHTGRGEGVCTFPDAKW